MSKRPPIVRKRIDSNINYSTIFPFKQSIVSTLALHSTYELGKLLTAFKLPLSMYEKRRV